MRTMLQLIGGVAAAGVVAAGTTAFTAGGGVGLGGSNGATATKFIGGTATQTVTGATINAIAYTWSDTANTKLSALDLTFADLTVRKVPTLTLTGLTPSSGGATFTCTAITGTGTNTDQAPFTSNCTPSAGTFDGQLTALNVTVP
ncbi:hypothetical protein ACTOB_000662 [Actinoplanes oblitus]|uniref:Uncharacterized protein n=1 Tax=Actinoplanes oblitus TaxID=3040509 RepID=A0ABY8WGY8_9ACTN|nr:hypothetical protein [Actinoplanes oblitus]WIM97161.1 hypothetical protein ACTOB_000662 [Actinoplanes oblitus]